MEISETCACGASFSANGDNVVRLVREWRIRHVCNEKVDPPLETVITSAETKTDLIGFQANGWQIDLPEKHGFEDE
jgi:hypothetical protein